jgi:SsrA-binding protein
MERMQKKVEPVEKKVFRKVVATNSKARFKYFVEETVEAGLILHGSEVKSLRTCRVNFGDSYARIQDNECWLIDLHLAVYDKAHVQLPDSLRRRKVLLNRREIAKLRSKTEMAGRTIVPLEIYFKGSWAKVLLGVCCGKNFGDKRAAIREAEVRRDIDRTLRNVKRGRV